MALFSHGFIAGLHIVGLWKLMINSSIILVYKLIMKKWMDYNFFNWLKFDYNFLILDFFTA